MSAVTARLVQHLRIAAPRQRSTALLKHEQDVSKSCNLQSARNLSACLPWSACANRRASGQSLTLAKLDEPGGRTLPQLLFYSVSILHDQIICRKSSLHRD